VLRSALSSGGPLGLLQGASHTHLCPLCTHTPHPLTCAVFLDDMATPLVSLPLAPSYFLSATGSGSVWVGLTASNADGWFATDVLDVSITV
jgi:hypothetical protein